jgi:lysozyme family protein
MPTFSASKKGYRNLWNKASVTRTSAAAKAAQHALKYRDRYEEAARGIGHPELWPLVAALHWRESTGDFRGILHNGERIIGTGRKTRLEPKGRGPFSSWQEAASNALRLKGWHRIKDWPLERWLYEAERYNGWGYIGKINSPYLWAGTDLQQRGKYVRDGVYDASYWDKQLGVVPVLKATFSYEPSAEPGYKPEPVPEPKPEPEPIPEPTPEPPVPVETEKVLSDVMKAVLPMIEKQYVVLTREQFDELVAALKKG